MNWSIRRRGRLGPTVSGAAAHGWHTVRRWLAGTLSTILGDTIARETGQLECCVLPHGDMWPLPLVGPA